MEPMSFDLPERKWKACRSGKPFEKAYQSDFISSWDGY